MATTMNMMSDKQAVNISGEVEGHPKIRKNSSPTRNMKALKMRKKSFRRLGEAERKIWQPLANFLFFLSTLGGYTVTCSECNASVTLEKDIENILTEHDEKSAECKLPHQKYDEYVKKNGHINSTKAELADSCNGDSSSEQRTGLEECATNQLPPSETHLELGHASVSPEEGNTEESTRNLYSGELNSLNGTSNIDTSVKVVDVTDGATNKITNRTSPTEGASSRKRDTHTNLREDVVPDMYSSDEELYQSSQISHAAAANGFNPEYSAYPDFSDKMHRLDSLHQWINPFRIDTQDLIQASEAGFFWKGEGSVLTCFYCGTHVPPLEKCDDAWIHHAKANTSCPFVQSVKGFLFMRQVSEMENAPDIEDAVIEQEIAAINREDKARFQESQRKGDVSGAAGAASQTWPPARSSTGAGGRAFNSSPRHVERRTTPVPPLPPGVRRPNYASKNRRVQKRNIQAREVRARLDMDWAKSLIKIGYPINLVGAVIADHMMFEGDDFKTFPEFLTAVIEASDMGESFPVEHYNLGLTESGAMRPSGVSSGAPRSRSPLSNSANTLSIGASSWSEPTPSPSSAMAQQRSNRGDFSFENGSINSLASENRELKERKMCKICFDKDADMVFTSCGHLVVCESCSHRIRECPMCRTPISGAIKAYLS